MAPNIIAPSANSVTDMPVPPRNLRSSLFLVFGDRYLSALATGGDLLMATDTVATYSLSHWQRRFHLGCCQLAAWDAVKMRRLPGSLQMMWTSPCLTGWP
jgi:hypothetical protein